MYMISGRILTSRPPAHIRFRVLIFYLAPLYESRRYFSSCVCKSTTLSLIIAYYVRDVTDSHHGVAVDANILSSYGKVHRETRSFQLLRLDGQSNRGA